jgi:hypothetical protein
MLFVVFVLVYDHIDITGISTGMVCNFPTRGLPVMNPIHHKCIALAILWHKHETHFIVCTKYESKGIPEKFKVLVKGYTK